MLYLTKIITAFVMPLGVVSGLLLVDFIGRILLQKWQKSWLVPTAFVVLWLSASPWMAIQAVGLLERQYPPLAMKEVPVSDVIIVLGGVSEPAAPPRVMLELNSAADRLTYAARLYAAGKSKIILVSGGTLDWFAKEGVEADRMAEVLGWLGVPQSAIVKETQSRNTTENAKFTARIWKNHGYETGLLVTSAFHMPRARMEFFNRGLKLTPASADILISEHGKHDIMKWFPSAVALNLTSLAVKEYLGLVVQWLRGKIK